MLEHPPSPMSENFASTWHPNDALFVPPDVKAPEQSNSASGDNVFFDERKLFLETVTETTCILFERAMRQNDMWLAFTQVQDSQKYSLPHYSEMRFKLVEHIEQVLLKSDTELSAKYKALLHAIRKEMEKSTFGDKFVWVPGGSRSRKTPRGQDPEYLQTLKEITPDLFETMIIRREVGWAYEHLKRACALELEDYPTMKEKFLALLDSELAKSDKQVGGEYRQRLEEWRDCLKVECWTQGTAAQ